MSSLIYRKFKRWQFLRKANKAIKGKGAKVTLYEDNKCVTDILQISKGQDFTHIAAGIHNYQDDYLINKIKLEVQ